MTPATANGVDSPPRTLVVAAFAAVYLFWGSTFLGIKVAMETIPPFLMAGSRFFLAGVLLYGWARWRGAGRPTRRQWVHAAVVGCLLLGVGNGAVTYVEQTLPTIIAALIISTTPVWLVILDWLHGGPRPRALTLAGLLMGMAGVVCIAAASHTHIQEPTGHLNVVILIAATLSWAYGSVWSRQADKPASPLLMVGMQMITAGLALTLVAVGFGEPRGLDPAAFSQRSILAWSYLLVAGSLIGFTAYIWLLQVTSTARVATHAYVNPVVAVILGIWLGNETLSTNAALGGGLVVVSIVLILGPFRTSPARTSTRAAIPKPSEAPNSALVEP